MAFYMQYYDLFEKIKKLLYNEHNKNKKLGDIYV